MMHQVVQDGFKFTFTIKVERDNPASSHMDRDNPADSKLGLCQCGARYEAIIMPTMFYCKGCWGKMPLLEQEEALQNHAQIELGARRFDGIDDPPKAELANDSMRPTTPAMTVAAKATKKDDDKGKKKDKGIKKGDGKKK